MFKNIVFPTSSKQIKKKTKITLWSAFQSSQEDPPRAPFWSTEKEHPIRYPSGSMPQWPRPHVIYDVSDHPGSAGTQRNSTGAQVASSPESTQGVIHISSSPVVRSIQ